MVSNKMIGKPSLNRFLKQHIYDLVALTWARREEFRMQVLLTELFNQLMAKYYFNIVNKKPTRLHNIIKSLGSSLSVLYSEIVMLVEEFKVIVDQLQQARVELLAIFDELNLPFIKDGSVDVLEFASFLVHLLHVLTHHPKPKGKTFKQHMTDKARNLADECYPKMKVIFERQAYFAAFIDRFGSLHLLRRYVSRIEFVFSKYNIDTHKVESNFCSRSIQQDSEMVIQPTADLQSIQGVSFSRETQKEARAFILK